MFHLFVECSDNFEKYLEKMVEKGGLVECRDAAAKFSTDVIGACAFSIHTNALTDENSQFRKIGKQALATNLQQFLNDRLREYPFLFKIFGRFFVDHEVTNFFANSIKDAMDYRIQNNVHLRDVIDILADIRENPTKCGLKGIIISI